MNFASPILIIAGVLIISMLCLGLTVKRFRKKSIVISVALLLLVAGIFIIPYNMAVSSKCVKTETIRTLEKNMKDRFHINSLKISISRGNKAYVEISVPDDFNTEAYQTIKEAVTEDIIQHVIDYCKNNFKASFVPDRNRFVLLIQKSGKFVYQADLLSSS